MRKVPLFRSVLGDEEIAAVSEVMRSGWIALGPKTAQFEQEYAEFMGAKHAIGLNSCTAALHLALAIWEFPKGSEVLMSTINFISAPHSALYSDLVPVFVDVDQETLSMDIEDLRRKITPKTKAIVATHLGGTPCDMDSVMVLAKEHNLIVVEDVANAVGGSYKGRMLGTIGDIGCHSFEAKKNMITGDGGMLTLNDDARADKLRRVRWLGINKDTWKRFSEKQGSYSWYYEVSELGYKYNMNDIMAAIGLVQLKKLPAIAKAKLAMVNSYNEKLQGIPWLKTPPVPKDADPSYWLYIIKVEDRDGFMAHLGSQGITTGVHFMPMHMHPLYKQEANTPVADRVWEGIVSLPLFVGMTEEDLDYVVEVIRSFTPKA